MGEWLKPAVLKTVELERVPGVRIPLPPPVYLFYNQSVSMHFAWHCGGIASRSWRGCQVAGKRAIISTNKVLLATVSFGPMHQSTPEQKCRRDACPSCR